MVYHSWEKDGIIQYQESNTGEKPSESLNQVDFLLPWEGLEQFIGYVLQLKMRTMKSEIALCGSMDRVFLKVTIITDSQGMELLSSLF